MNNTKTNFELLQDEFSLYVPELVAKWVPSDVIFYRDNVVHYRTRKIVAQMEYKDGRVYLIGCIDEHSDEHHFSSIIYTPKDAAEQRKIEQMFLSFGYALDERRNRTFEVKSGMFTI